MSTAHFEKLRDLQLNMKASTSSNSSPQFFPKFYSNPTNQLPCLASPYQNIYFQNTYSHNVFISLISHFLVGLGVGFAKKLQCGIWIWRFIHQQRGNYIYLINIILTFEITTTWVMYQMVFFPVFFFLQFPYKQREHFATVPTCEKISLAALQRSYNLGSSWVGLTV